MYREIASAHFGFPMITRLMRVSLFCAAFGASALFAQVDRAVLEGTVTDQNGGVLVGARVQATAADTGIVQEQLTNTNGYYRLPGRHPAGPRQPADPLRAGSLSAA